MPQELDDRCDEFEHGNFEPDSSPFMPLDLLKQQPPTLLNFSDLRDLQESGSQLLPNGYGLFGRPDGSWQLRIPSIQAVVSIGRGGLAASVTGNECEVTRLICKTHGTPIYVVNLPNSNTIIYRQWEGSLTMENKPFGHVETMTTRIHDIRPLTYPKQK